MSNGYSGHGIWKINSNRPFFRVYFKCCRQGIVRHFKSKTVNDNGFVILLWPQGKGFRFLRNWVC